MEIFGQTKWSPDYYTNKFTLISSSQIDFWDSFMNSSGVFGSLSLSVKESLYFAGHWAGFKYKFHLTTRLEQLLHIFRLKEKESRLVR